MDKLLFEFREVGFEPFSTEEGMFMYGVNALRNELRNGCYVIFTQTTGQIRGVVFSEEKVKHYVETHNMTLEYDEEPLDYIFTDFVVI